MQRDGVAPLAKQNERLKFSFPNTPGAWVGSLLLTAAVAVIASTVASVGGPARGTEFTYSATVGTGAVIFTGPLNFSSDVNFVPDLETGPTPGPRLPASLASWNDPRLLSTGERCLAQAVYFEARGEPFEGQLAVAQVVLNRVRDERYPNEICAVVFENETWRHRCQFSFACDGRSDRPKDLSAWLNAIKTARMVGTGQLRDVTYASTHYHAEYVEPEWAERFHRTVKIGRHYFYRNETAIR